MIDRVWDTAVVRDHHGERLPIEADMEAVAGTKPIQSLAQMFIVGHPTAGGGDNGLAPRYFYGFLRPSWTRWPRRGALTALQLSAYALPIIVVAR